MKKPPAKNKGKKYKKPRTEKKSKLVVPSRDKDDTQCPMCDGFWSESLPGEEWVKLFGVLSMVA